MSNTQDQGPHVDTIHEGCREEKDLTIVQQDAVQNPDTIDTEGNASEGDGDEVDAHKILESCSFIRHCREDEATLTQDEQYAMISVFARTERGPEVCHLFAEDFPGYEKQAVDEKIQQALQETEPMTCRTIQRKCGKKWCEGCKARVRSPFVLGGNESYDIAEKQKEGEEILAFISRKATFFHDEQQNPMATISIGDHTEIMRTDNSTFEDWLLGSFYKEKGRVPRSETLRQALKVIGAKARYDGPEVKMNLRVAEFEGDYWYDLADDDWRAIRISPGTWRIEDKPPILFTRHSNTARQVVPATGGDPRRLLEYINLASEEDQCLFMVTVVTCFIPGISHVFPVFHGDQGAAKSTAMRILRRIVDPAQQELTALPTSEENLAVLLSHNYAPCFDNVDYLRPWQSDMLCCAVTGGGISKRKIYTNDEEVILSYRRCLAINGINLVATRPDLLDRSVIFNLERISNARRREETEFWASFEQDRPGIVGGILDALAAAKRIYPDVRLEERPRMADYARWGYAVSEALGFGGDTFLRAYQRNRGSANTEAIACNAVADATMALMREKDSWQGTMGELLECLEEVAKEEKINIRSKEWPKTPQSLARKLNTMKSNLRETGIDLSISRDSSNRSHVVFQRKKQEGSGISGSPDCRTEAEESPGDMPEGATKA